MIMTSIEKYLVREINVPAQDKSTIALLLMNGASQQNFNSCYKSWQIKSNPQHYLQQ